MRYETTIDDVINWLTSGDVPEDILTGLLQAADRRLAIIAKALESRPDLPLLSNERVTERIADALQYLNEEEEPDRQ
jgi:hypothetical protein